MAYLNLPPGGIEWCAPQHVTTSSVAEIHAGCFPFEKAAQACIVHEDSLELELTHYGGLPTQSLNALQGMAGIYTWQGSLSRAFKACMSICAD